MTGQSVPGTGSGSINLSILVGSMTGTLKRGSLTVGIVVGAARPLVLGHIQGAETAAPAATPVFKSRLLVSMSMSPLCFVGSFLTLFWRKFDTTERSEIDLNQEKLVNHKYLP